jgi:hypothetical protein
MRQRNEAELYRQPVIDHRVGTQPLLNRSSPKLRTAGKPHFRIEATAGSPGLTGDGAERGYPYDAFIRFFMLVLTDALDSLWSLPEQAGALTAIRDSLIMTAIEVPPGDHSNPSACALP